MAKWCSPPIPQIAKIQNLYIEFEFLESLKIQNLYMTARRDPFLNRRYLFVNSFLKLISSTNNNVGQTKEIISLTN
jgi:hypothetical protein